MAGNLGGEILVGAPEDEEETPLIDIQLNFLDKTKSAPCQMSLTRDDTSAAEQFQKRAYSEDGLKATRARSYPEEIKSIDTAKPLEIGLSNDQQHQNIVLPSEIMGNLLGMGTNVLMEFGVPCHVCLSQPGVDNVIKFDLAEDQLLSPTQTEFKFTRRKGETCESDLDLLL